MIQTQLRKIDLVDLDIDTNLSPAEFWGKLRMYERGGEFTFRELYDHALNVLTIPFSTAFVERIFSIISYTKNDYRNKMQTPTLNALILLKSHLQEIFKTLIFMENFETYMKYFETYITITKQTKPFIISIHFIQIFSCR